MEDIEQREDRLSGAFIYFIQAGPAVKIGTARNIGVRMQTLQSANPVELVLRLVLNGSTRRETRLHELFAMHRLRGEWFSICSEIEAFMESKANEEAAVLAVWQEKQERRAQREPTVEDIRAAYAKIEW